MIYNWNFNNTLSSPSELSSEGTSVDLESKVAELQRQIDEIKSINNFDIKYPMNEDSKKILRDIIAESTPQMWWDEVFYLSSVFESVDRFLVTAAVTISDTGLEISTSAGAAGAVLYQENDVPINIDNETFFSTTVTLTDVSAANFSVDILVGTLGYVSIGIDAGTINGRTNDGSGTTTVELGSASDNGAYLLECRYQPGYKVEFFVDGELAGTSTSRLQYPRQGQYPVQSSVSFKN